MCSPKSDFSWPLSFAVAVFPGRLNEDSYVSVSCGELIFFLIKAGFVTDADTPRSESFHQWVSKPWFSARQCCSSSFHLCIPLVCSHLEEDRFKTSQLLCFYNPYQFKDWKKQLPKMARWSDQRFGEISLQQAWIPALTIQTTFIKSCSLMLFSYLLQGAGGSCHSCSVLVQGITVKEYSEVHGFK